MKVLTTYSTFNDECNRNEIHEITGYVIEDDAISDNAMVNIACGLDYGDCCDISLDVKDAKKLVDQLIKAIDKIESSQYEETPLTINGLRKIMGMD